ncbi:glycosyltransferase family 4 protein [Tenacibaculum sp. SG-28]|uniref:MraY family glycosyltransferase n=1 Tax=Tenacibaculum sp. SG-28 TaxID=754426 RepID=UPI000CF423B4|nr:glycosyltransferase family 4 protein [Tenacibaculum sp. SG-28]PQJ21087.1 hypothetical protein BSU00_08730 [Tenacibaculum sp. SG-28]
MSSTQFLNIIITIVLYSSSVLYIRFADKYNIIDKPNHRSSHTIPTIRGGGILFYVAILLYFFISGFQYPYFVLGVSLIAIVSFVDDIITLSSNLRLPFQFIAVGLCIYQIGISIDDLFIFLPLLIVGVGFINIYNFMDGINGITGLYSVVTLVLFYFINLQEDILDARLNLYVLMSVIIFGFYNFRTKARMFSGDIGSISIAIVVFFTGVILIKELNAPILILSMLLYGTDSILTLIYRKSIGEKITEPHRKHIYQKMVHELKLSHMKVSMVYALLQILINLVVFKFYNADLNTQLFIIFLAIGFSISLYIMIFKYVEKTQKKLK